MIAKHRCSDGDIKGFGTPKSRNGKFLAYERLQFRGDTMGLIAHQ